MLVDDLDLPTYVHSVLSRAGIERVSDLLGTPRKSSSPSPAWGKRASKRCGVAGRERRLGAPR